MTLALFDLDNTLLNGDSDHAWGEFIVEQGLVNRDQHQRTNERYYQQYLAGKLDIGEFLQFQLKLLSEHSMDKLIRWRDHYLQQKIEPMIHETAISLVNNHREKGHRLVIITSTNSFLTRPIAQRFGIDELIATEPEIKGERYTGSYIGTPCFQQGKVERLHRWLEKENESLAESWGYSDSHNDIPFLKTCSNPVAVNPDPKLLDYARLHQWPVIELSTHNNATNHEVTPHE